MVYNLSFSPSYLFSKFELGRWVINPNVELVTTPNFKYLDYLKFTYSHCYFWTFCLMLPCERSVCIIALSWGLIAEEMPKCPNWSHHTRSNQVKPISPHVMVGVETYHQEYDIFLWLHLYYQEAEEEWYLLAFSDFNICWNLGQELGMY